MKVPTGRWFQPSVGSKGEGPRTSQKLFTSLSRTPLSIPAIGWLVGKTLTTCRGLACSGDASGDGPIREIFAFNVTPTAPPQFRFRSQRQHTWFAIARDTAEQIIDYTKTARRHGWFATWRDLLPILRVTTPGARGTRAQAKRSFTAILGGLVIMRQAPAPMVVDATPALARQLRNSNRWKEASISLPGFGQHQGHYIAAVHADASQQAVLFKNVFEKSFLECSSPQKNTTGSSIKYHCCGLRLGGCLVHKCAHSFSGNRSNLEASDRRTCIQAVTASMASPVMPKSLDNVPKNLAAAICEADAPYSVNTALYPVSSSTMSPRSTTLSVYV